MIYVEPAPTAQRVGELLRVGGLYYFRCKTRKNREVVRKFIQDMAREAGVYASCQGVQINTVAQPVLKVQFKTDIPLPVWGREQIKEDAS